MKSPKCCLKWMELKTSMFFKGYSINYEKLFFQCKKCGKIEIEYA